MEEFVKRFFNLRAFLQQADTQLTPSKFLFISIGMGVGTTVILPIIRVPQSKNGAGPYEFRKRIRR